MKLSDRLGFLRERIQQRVEGSVPELPELRGVPLAELQEKRAEARDWAAAVGGVNPRRNRLHDRLVQAVKRVIARALRWHVLPQRQFNTAVLESLEAIERVLAAEQQNQRVLAQAAVQSLDWAARANAELQNIQQRLSEQVAELQRLFDGRITAGASESRAKDDFLEYHLRENVKSLNESINKIQAELWAFQLKHEEQLRLLRRRVAAAGAGESGSGMLSETGAATRRGFDYPHFEQRFRGIEPEIRERQAIYLPLFKGRAPVLDIACGRGEFLAFLREQGIDARGVDLDPDMVASSREHGLNVECGDAFVYLDGVPDDSLGAVFSAQFIEHLPPAGYVRLIELAYRKLRAGGLLLLETQDPECLVTLSRNFYLDPTHVQPVPAMQTRFWMEEAGFKDLKLFNVSPVSPKLPLLPTFDPPLDAATEKWNREAVRFNETYFGYQDYAIAGYKPQ